MSYDAFISYGHASDHDLAPAIQSGLHKLTKKWTQLRALNVFRDDTGLSANSALWPAIEAALDDSTWFIYLASPHAARSVWVEREVSHWLKTKSSDTILIVLTEGAMSWNPDLEAFDPNISNSLVPSLISAFQNEPLYVDLTWANEADHRRLSNNDFRDAIADLAAPIHGVAKDQLVHEDISTLKKAKQLRTTAVLTVLLLIASVAAMITRAVSQHIEITNTNSKVLEPLVDEKLAAEDYEIAALIALESWRDEDAITARMLNKLVKPSRTGLLISLRAALAQISAAEIQARNTGHAGLINTASYSADENMILTGSVDATARIWDAESGKNIQVFSGHSGSLNSAIFSKDNSKILTAANDSHIALWDSSNADLIKNFEVKSLVHDAAFSRDEKKILFADGGLIGILDIESGEQQLTVEAQSFFVRSVQFDKDNIRILSSGDDHTAKLWDANTGRLIRTFEGHLKSVYTAEFSNDEKQIVTSSEDGTAKLWDIETGDIIHTFNSNTGVLNTALFSPDQKYILTAGRDGIPRLWDRYTGDQITAEFDKIGPISSATFSKHEKAILFTSESRSGVTRWDHSTGTFTSNLDNYSGSIKMADWSPDRSTVLTLDDQGYVRLWDSYTAKEIYTFNIENRYFNSGVFSSTGEFVLTAGTDGTARLWNTVTGDGAITYSRHKGEINSAVFSNTNNIVLTAGDDGTVRLWDRDSAEQLLELNKHSGRVFSAEFSPDDNIVLSKDETNTIRLWNADNGSLLHVLNGESAQFSIDSKLILTVNSDDTAKLWSAETGNTILSMDNHTDWINTANFSSDDSKIITASGDGTLRVWDVSSGDEITTITGPIDDDFLEIEVEFTSAEFFDNDRKIISSGDDYVVRIWDAETGKQLDFFSEHNGWINSVVISNDNTTVLTASDDTTWISWRLHSSLLSEYDDQQKLTQYAKEKIGRCLTSSERSILKLEPSDPRWCDLYNR